MSTRTVCVFLLLAAICLCAILLGARGYRNATAMPLVRRLQLEVPGYPDSTPPITIVLFSDVHVDGLVTTPERLERIVKQINDLKPDIIVAAGDFTSRTATGGEYPVEGAMAPLRALKARYGAYAVLGNNDDRAEATVHALTRAGIHVLVNDAVRVGPAVIGGLDGRLAGPWLIAGKRKTYAEMTAMRGIKILVSHKPDDFLRSPTDVSLVLAGHTHCGQIVVPFVGPLETQSGLARKYLCGVFREGSKVLVVTGGIGVSHLPFRFGAAPDLWLISIRGPPNDFQHRGAPPATNV